MFLMRLFFWKQSSKNRERPQFVRCMSILDFFILSNCLTYQHCITPRHLFLYHFFMFMKPSHRYHFYYTIYLYINICQIEISDYIIPKT